MLPSKEIEILEYVDARGRSPFAEWFDNLSAETAARVRWAIARMSQGNFSRVKGLGGAIYEYRIDFGPGLRIYFGKDGETVVILLAGGSKRRQERDIAIARLHWEDYKHRKPHD
jgi:putative addiction module killer protein